MTTAQDQEASKLDVVSPIEAFSLESLFSGLRVIHPRFDPTSIAYFTPDDFQTVIRRCSACGIEIYGIEIFTRNGGLVAVEFAPGESRLGDNSWCLDVIVQHQRGDNRLVSATYSCSAEGNKS